MRLLSDRIQEFIDWLEANTDFCEWDNSVKNEVHRMLIVFMISDERIKGIFDANDEQRELRRAVLHVQGRARDT